MKFKVRRLIEVEVEAVDKHDAQNRIEYRSEVVVTYQKGGYPNLVPTQVNAKLLSSKDLAQFMYGAEEVQ